MMICTICARGGSKGVPGKNLRELAGRPLIAHSVEHAFAADRFDVVAVSSDDEAILEAAREAGAHHVVRRPDSLAQDDSAKSPAIVHCVRTVEERTGQSYGTMVDLDATSPLRQPHDITGALDLLGSGGFDNVISVTPARKSPYFNLVERDRQGLAVLSKSPPSAVVRRQDAPPCYDINGSVYVWTRACFLAGAPALGSRTGLYEMPEERSVDVDTELDWSLVELLMSRRGGTA